MKLMYSHRNGEVGRAIARLGLESLLHERVGFWAVSRFPAEEVQASLWK